ncbi:2902_t:CDS:2, partial [Ambispora leptoticha]
HIEDLALAHRLEHYRSRQEAAKGFDDDLEFCPSLSAEELAEYRRKASQRILKPNVTPPQPK